MSRPAHPVPAKRGPDLGSNLRERLVVEAQLAAQRRGDGRALAWRLEKLNEPRLCARLVDGVDRCA